MEEQNKGKKYGRFFVLLVIGFMLGRVWIDTVNPFAIAFMGVSCKNKRQMGIMAVVVLCGMFTATSGNHLIKYIVVVSLITLFVNFWEQLQRGIFPLWIVAAICAAVNMAMGVLGSLLVMSSWTNFWMSLGEGVAVYAMGRVFAPGVMQIRRMSGRELLNNEMLISLLMLIFIALYAIPDFADSLFSVSKTIGYFMILFVGLRQGAAAGALTGLAAGLLGIVQGGDPSLAGFYSGLGVFCGSFRKTGKYISMILYTLAGGFIIYVAGSEFDAMIEFRSIISGALLLLALPKKCLWVEEPNEVKEEILPKGLPEVTNQRISDFSDAFRRLAKNFGDGTSQQSEITSEDLEAMMTEISRKLCASCMNCNYCWGSQKERTVQGMSCFLEQMERVGEFSVVDDNREFARRCMCFDDFLDMATQKVSLAKQQLGWKNRMARNREIMAKQMVEVARALKGFTLYLGEGEVLSEKIREQMRRTLEHQGIIVDNLFAAKKNGKISVSFVGYYEENGCMTKTDVAKLLSQVVGVNLCPARETRNVLSTEKQQMFFHEDTLYRARTGVARVAKWDETVSGDNFSFLELESGELLMVLADGMGCGLPAEQESGSLVETLEYLIEAGFEKTAAWRLLNALLAAGYEGDSFSTLDIVALNLYQGKCEFIKSGAAATYIYHKGEVETIQSHTLPLGMSMEESCEVMKKTLADGDFVIMISDGVADHYEDKGEGDMTELIKEVACPNAQEFANQILLHALAEGDHRATDDMTVLVASIWS